jgi:methylmalonyl-CoA/ethylmalonyl-CoA epimerase
MSNTEKIHHIAIVVNDIKDALNFWHIALGLEHSPIREIHEQDVRVSFLALKNSKIELVEPTKGETGIARYLEKKGAGIHHVCLEVEDIHATLKMLENSSIRLINETPQKDSEGKLFAFIHPESTSGVLLELYQLPDKES